MQDKLLMLRPVVYCPLESGLIFQLGYAWGELVPTGYGSRKVGVAKGTNTTGNIFKGLRICSSTTIMGDKNVLSRDGQFVM